MSATVLPAAPRAWRLVLRDVPLPVAASAALAALLMLLALAAPVIAPFDPNGQTLLARLRPPAGFAGFDPRHWLGTDQLGRDMLSRCLYGLRLSLFLSLSGTVIGLLLGTGLGMLAALGGRVADTLIMGIVDVKLALPFTLVALVVIAVAGNGIFVLVTVLGIAYWAHFARLVRAELMALRNLPYVEAARAAGASGWRLALVHMLPNIVSPVVVMTTLNFSNLILLESSLSFLGLGVQPPTATLGSMVGLGRDYMASAPWIVAAPALLIIAVSLAVMLLGDFLRDRFDVRLRDR